MPYFLRRQESKTPKPHTSEELSNDLSAEASALALEGLKASTRTGDVYRISATIDIPSSALAEICPISIPRIRTLLGRIIIPVSPLGILQCRIFYVGRNHTAHHPSIIHAATKLLIRLVSPVNCVWNKQEICERDVEARVFEERCETGANQLILNGQPNDA
jgi:hypothetical protein